MENYNSEKKYLEDQKEKINSYDKNQLLISYENFLRTIVEEKSDESSWLKLEKSDAENLFEHTKQIIKKRFEENYQKVLFEILEGKLDHRSLSFLNKEQVTVIRNLHLKLKRLEEFHSKKIKDPVTLEEIESGITTTGPKLRKTIKKEIKVRDNETDNFESLFEAIVLKVSQKIETEIERTGSYTAYI